MLIGLISDTHGLVRPDVATVFADVSLILHAGDVGSREVLTELECVAPVQAVHGNVDPFELMLPSTLVERAGPFEIFVTHGHELGSPTPEKLAARYRGDVIVFGHTHRAVVRHIGSTLVVNPGAAGPRRFNSKPSVALLTIANGAVEVQVVNLA